MSTLSNLLGSNFRGDAGNTGVYIANTAPLDTNVLWLDLSDPNGQGVSIPSGGANGTILRKSSSTDFDVDWSIVNYDIVYTITDAANFEINPANGGIQLITLGASRTPKATNFTPGQSVTLMVDDGTDYTITWTDATFGGSGVVWKTDTGTAPTLNTTGYTTIVLWKIDTQVYGARVGDS